MKYRKINLRFFSFIFLIVLLTGCDSIPPSSNTVIPPLPAEAENKEENFDASIFAENIFLNPELRFEHLGLLNGLSNSTATCAVQDIRGVMWIGTFDGLNKFDGYQFTVFRHNADDPNSLADNLIYNIYADQEGFLWIGTDRGLSKFDTRTEQFVNYLYGLDVPNSLSNDVINVIYEGNNGYLWIGTESGLNRLNKQTGEIKQYKTFSENPIMDNFIYALYQDVDGLLWIGSRGGLSLFDPEKEKFQLPGQLISTYLNDQIAVNQITSMRSGELWIGTTNGVIAVAADRLSVRWYEYREFDKTSLSNSVVTSIFEDQFGLIWIGTEDGLNLFNQSRDKFIQFKRSAFDPNSLGNNLIYDIYQDSSGGLWFLNANGISKVDITTKQFIHYHNLPNDSNSLVDNQVYAICEDKNGFLWIGTSNGLDRLDRRTNHYRHFEHDSSDPTSLSDNYITSILEDSEGNMWFGTESGGVNRFDPITEQFLQYKYNPVTTNSISNNKISMLLEDNAGFIWIATAQGMIDRLNPKLNLYKHYQLQAGDELAQLKVKVRSMIESENGEIWLGTSYGLYRFNPVSDEFFRYLHDPNDEHSISDDSVLSVVEDSKHQIWVGTYGGGLNLLPVNQSQFTNFTHLDGLANDTVYGIIEDDFGMLWLSTNHGLSKFDPQTKLFENFDAQDGIQSNEFNEKAGFKASSGEIFFGGVNGVTAFYPQNIHKNPFSPRVILTGLQVSGQSLVSETSIETVDQIELKWPENHFEFTFAGLNFQQPENNRYAYYLDGFDKNWNLNGNLRYGRYTNLPGGDYTLYLAASNEDGVWGEKQETITVIVKPPFWETTMFQWGVILFVALVGVSGYLLKMRSVQVRNRELEILVEERTAEIEQRREVAEGLKEVLFLLNSNKPLQESLNIIVRSAMQLNNADHVMLLSIQDEPVPYVTIRGSQRSDLAILSDENNLKEESPEFINWLAELAKDGKTLVVENITRFIIRQEAIEIQKHNPYASMLIIPILSAEELFGSLVFLYINSQTFEGEFVGLAESFAEQAALAIGNAQLRDRVKQIAIVSERNRLARDLHDAVTQTLFSASLISEALPSVYENNSEDGRLLLQELRQLSRGALAEMRTLLLELRPSAVLESKMYDLIRQLTESASGRTGMDIDFQVNLPVPLPDDVHISIYRIAQEALNNVVKHAHAKNTEVIVNGTENSDGTQNVFLSVRDDGIGFDTNRLSNGHFGLNIIQERVNLIAGELILQSEINHGTLLKVLWHGRAKEDE